MTKSNFALASYQKMKPGTPEDQRQSERTPVNGWQASFFADNSVLVLESEVIDSSAHGVGLIIPAAELGLDANMELTLTLDTGHKKLTRKAKVCWFQPSDQGLRLGVEFIDHTHITPGDHQLDIQSVRVDPAWAMKIPAAIAVRRKVLPFIEINQVVHVAVANLKNQTLLHSLERMLKASIITWQVNEDDLDLVLKKVYGNVLSQPKSATVKKEDDQLAEIVELANRLLDSAFLRGASDIHLDPNPKGSTIRFRIDGQLEVFEQLKADTTTELTGRLKVMAGLDIAEKRAPQDGRFSHTISGNRGKVDLRVATLPTRYGERLTLRLLVSQETALTLNQLGFQPQHQHLVENFLKRIQGMMILTGPTGSGKTTTLYAAINMLLAEKPVNIMTVEDPIEYEIAGAAQCEIDSNSDKVTFNSALRSILRHDPDVVMIGEIRDKETAEIAIKAALTGHMVLSTLHTNSAAATVTRLIDMGVKPYLVAAALRLSVAQRLLRRLCSVCRIARPLTEKEAISIDRLDLAGTTVYDPSGCIYCGNKGYKGPIGLDELLELKPAWARAVAEGQSESELVAKMRASGVKSLLEDATDKMLAGHTSFDEVMQVASSW
jgi:type IV pilus assembly protein PilB